MSECLELIEKFSLLTGAHGDVVDEWPEPVAPFISLSNRCDTVLENFSLEDKLDLFERLLNYRFTPTFTYKGKQYWTPIAVSKILNE